MSGSSLSESVTTIQALMRQLGVTPEDLVSTRVTLSLGDFVRASVVPALTVSQVAAWKPYVAVVLE